MRDEKEREAQQHGEGAVGGQQHRRQQSQQGPAAHPSHFSWPKEIQEDGTGKRKSQEDKVSRNLSIPSSLRNPNSSNSWLNFFPTCVG